MSLKKRIISGLVWTATEQFGNQLIGFVISIILARILLPEQFGLIGMITIFVALGNTLLQSGLTISLIRGERLSPIDYSTVFYYNVAVSLLLYLSVFLLAPLIANFYDQYILIRVVRVYCLTFITSGISAVPFARLTKRMDFKTQTIIAIPSVLIGGVVGILLAVLGYGVWSLVWSSLTGAILNTIQLWLYSNWRPQLVFDIQKLKWHLNYGYKLTLSELLDKVFKNIFLISIGKFYSASQVGYYNRADTIKQLPVRNISKALDRVTFPLFVSIKNEDERLRRVYSKIMKMIFFIITPILITLAILGEPLFRFLLTEKWLPAVPYFQILCITGILYPLHVYNLDVLNVKGRSDLFLKVEVYKKILIVIVLVVTIPIGIMEMLYGQVFISIISFYINAHYSGRFINYSASKQVKDLLPVALICMILAVLLYLLDNFLFRSFPDLVRIVSGILISAIFYIAIAYSFKIGSLFELIAIIFNKEDYKR